MPVAMPTPSLDGSEGRGGTDFASTVFQDKIFVFGGEGPTTGTNILTCEFFDGIKWQLFCHLPSDITPLSAVLFPMIPNVEQNISRMYLLPEHLNDFTDYSHGQPRQARFLLSDDSGHESDEESIDSDLSND
uniref:Uncharacterized protein n=1 Tax=Panagrolaimus sp. JU765 TaxID=591449 RepID=A0AC34RDV4_9BILA